MNRTTFRSLSSVLCAPIMLTALGCAPGADRSAVLAHQEWDGAEQPREGARARLAHGFVRRDGVFVTIDAPRADGFTIAFGIDRRGRSVGAFVDRKGTLHGFLSDQCDFSAIDFPGARATFATRINHRGQVVGAYSHEANTPVLTMPHGFLLEDGVFTAIDVPNARRTQPFGINDRGQIVGEYVDAGGISHGFLLDNGAFITLDAPGGASTIAFDINNNGQIIGVSFTDVVVTGLGPAFLRDASGAFTTIAVPGATRIFPFGINNRGQVVGEFEDAASNSHGFLLDQGAITTIDAPDAVRGTFAFDINDRGALAGATDIAAHGYFEERRGDFVTIDHPEAVRLTGEPIGINNRGQIVGAYVDVQGVFHGFLRDRRGSSNIDVPDAQLTAPFKINDRGQIVGQFNDAGGMTHGFVLDAGAVTTIDFPGADDRGCRYRQPWRHPRSVPGHRWRVP